MLNATIVLQLSENHDLGGSIGLVTGMQAEYLVFMSKVYLQFIGAMIINKFKIAGHI